MKNIFFFILLLPFQILCSQNNYPPTGTVTLDTKLNVGKQIAPSSTPGETIRLSITPYGHTGGPWNFKARDNASLAFLDIDYGIGTALTINSDKNIGIGISNPVSKLSIDGSITLNSGLNNTLPRPALSSGTLVKGEIRSYSGAGNLYDDGFLRLSAGGGTTTSVKSFIDISGYSTIPDMNNSIVLGTAGAEKMRIDKSGNIGIGTNSPKNKLDVKGTIHSQEVKVDMTGWSDFVFKKEYNLPTLKEVEKHIAEKGHLENIPSEEEVLKNGINLGEMNTKLLQKIEELTLYSIQQNKKIEEQSKEIESLKSLALRVAKLEKESARK